MAQAGLTRDELANRGERKRTNPVLKPSLGSPMHC